MTRAAINLKLGLVLVSAYPESVIQAHINARKAALAEETASLDAEIEAASDRYRSARSISDAAMKALDRMPMVTVNENEAAWIARDRQRTKALAAESYAERATKVFQGLVEKRDHLGSASFYFISLPPSPVSAKTDADGRFTLHVPPGISLVLVATASREVSGSTETYYWMVRVLPDAGQSNRLFLSNDNLVTTQSEQSVLHAPEG